MNGATNCASQSTEGRSSPPVKPTSEVAHQPGQQPAAPKLTLRDVLMYLADGEGIDW